MTTARNLGGRFVLLGTLLLAASDATAQTPVQSFADLQPLVKTGQQVIVWDDDGRKIKAEVLSLSGNQLEIQRWRWFFRRERQLFTEDSVRRIENPDSTANGGLLGVGVGGLMAALRCWADDWGWACLPWITLAPTAGGFVGAAIDGAVNQPLYVSPRAGGVTLVPLLGRERAGLAARIRF
jgi:hypothetical protein